MIALSKGAEPEWMELLVFGSSSGCRISEHI